MVYYDYMKRLLRSNYIYLEVKNLENRLKRLSQETRYKQLKRLREENRDPEYKFIYRDYPVESDDVISYMQGRKHWTVQ
ncbi:MAG: hypothetical protein Q8Q47_08720 [Ignavibacteriaceae bacterium]|nr:hypothetical protein [Ignavibacteriaceae bacterium]